MNVDIIEDIRNNQIRGCYYFYGPERYLMDLYLQKIEEVVIPEKIDGLNYETYHYRDIGIPSLLAAANTMSFMGDKKMIVVRESELLSKEKSLSAPALKAFQSYLNEPNPMTVLIFIGEKEIKAVSKNKIAAMIKKSSLASLILADKLKGSALKQHIREQVSRKGLVIASNEVLERLVLIAEKGLYYLDNELEKLSLRNSDGTINVEEAERLISYTPEGKIFELVDAVISKNGKKAIQLLDDYLGAGEPEYMLRAMLISSFRRLLIIKDAMAAGYMKPVFVKYVDTSSDYVIDKSVRQVRNASIGQLEAVYERLYHFEYLSRSSRQDPKKLLKDCIVEISF